jgi:type VI secretion system secreted protein Hcp
MAVDMFLKLDGIKGEPRDHKHKDEIHIESFRWGMNQTGAHATGGGGGAGKVNVHDIGKPAGEMGWNVKANQKM